MLKRYKTAMEAAYETGEGTATAAEQGEADTSAEVLTPYTSTAQAQESASIFIQQYSDRVAAGITSSTLDFTACVATVLDAASRARRDFTLAARRLCSHRGMWMDKHIEELDAVEKALKAHARLFRVIHVSDVLSAVLATSRALTDTDTLPQSSRMIDVCVGGRDTVMSTLLACNRVESFTSPVCVSLSGSGVEWCKPGSESHCLDHNTIHLSYVDSSGDPIRGVVPSDVTVWFSCPEGVTCCEVVSLLPTSSSTFELKYRVEAAEKRPYVMYVGMHLSLLHNSVGIASPSVFDIVVQVSRTEQMCM